MKTIQLYFSATKDREEQSRVFHKNQLVGYVRAVLISDCDITHATMKGRVHARPGEQFVGAVAVE